MGALPLNYLPVPIPSEQLGWKNVVRRSEALYSVLPYRPPPAVLSGLGQQPEQGEKTPSPPQDKSSQTPSIIQAIGEAIKGIIEAFKGTSRYQYQYEAQRDVYAQQQSLFRSQQFFAYVVIAIVAITLIGFVAASVFQSRRGGS